MNRISACCLLACAAALLAGCASRPREPEVDLAAIIAEVGKPVVVDCAADPARCESRRTTCRDQRDGGDCTTFDLHFIDIADGGLDPFRAGCHMEHGDAMCTTNTQFFRADNCLTPTVLEEWWRSICHKAEADTMSFDCAELCRLARRGPGSCEPVENACPGGRHSARCVCKEPVTP